MRSRSSGCLGLTGLLKATAGAAPRGYGGKWPGRQAPWLEAVEGRVLLSAWSLSTVASFAGSNGVHSNTPLTADAQGNLFGTTQNGGSYNQGTVFEIPKGSTAITTLVSFNGANRGAAPPLTGVVLDAQGNLYGTTEYGGQSDQGVIFEIAKGSNVITTLVSLNSGGMASNSGLTIDASGNLYAPTLSGRIVELARGTSALTVLATTSSATGTNPNGPLLMDASGNLYGIATTGGSVNAGTVYELAKGSNSVTDLANFGGLAGAGPIGPLAMDAYGNLYGAALRGGNGQTGEVFELPNGSAAITDLASFTNRLLPRGGVILDPAGNIYGAAGGYEWSDPGAVFEVAKGSSTVTALATFNQANGALPNPPLLDDYGNLYGTTYGSGFRNNGTVFELTPNTSVSVKLTSGKNPSNTNKQLTYTATVTGGVPDGQTVLLADQNNNGAYLAAGVVVNGTATLTVLPNRLSGGTHELIAAYTGTPSYAASFSPPIEQTIVPPNYRPPLTGPTPPTGGSQTPTSGWTQNTLASFTSNYPAAYYSPLIVDSNGNVFGTTQDGGTYRQGSVFEIGKGSGAITTLASFNGVNRGAVFPRGGVVLDAQGNLYGTTEYGGQSDEGVIFEIAKGSNTLTTVVSLRAGYVSTGLTIDASGNLYAPTDGGNIIEVAQGTGAQTVLASFNGSNGRNPSSPLLLDAAGNLYGSTAGGGAANKGTIYEVAHGSGQITDLASFTVDGNPAGALAMDSAGNIYGTARTSVPTIFKFTRSNGAITDLVSMNGLPVGGVLMDAAGDLYVANGGNLDEPGSLFEFVRGSSTLTTIATFQAPAIVVGLVTVGPVTLDSAGNIYGIATAGYDSGYHGTVFELTPNTSASFRLTGGTNPTNANDQLTYTATVTGGIPDGETILLEDASNGDAYVAAGIIVNGSATLTILPNTLSVGSHKLIVVYNGDGTHATSISTPLIQTIFPAGYRPPRTV